MALRARIGGWARGEQGFALVMFLVLLPFVILALVTLIDIQRASVNKAELQMVADALAKAGAVELDGKVDALDRATARMQGVVNTVMIPNLTTAPTPLNYRLGTLPADQLQAIFLDQAPAAGAALDDAWLAGHATTDHDLAHYVYVRAALPGFASVTGKLMGRALPFATVHATAVARYVQQNLRLRGPCDLGLFADTGTITGGNNAQFTGSLTLYAGAGIALGRPTIAPATVVISTASPTTVTNLTGGTFVPTTALACQPYGVALAQQLNSTLSPTNRGLLPDWTDSYTLSTLSGTSYATLASGSLYTISKSTTLAVGGSSTGVVIMSTGATVSTVTLDRNYRLSDAVIKTNGNIVVNDGVVLQNVTLIAGGSITFGNTVDMADPARCANRNYGVEMYAGANITMINAYKLCGVMAAAVGTLDIKNTANAGDADIRNVHLEAGGNLIFKNNLEYEGVAVVSGDDIPFDSDYTDVEGVSQITTLSGLVDF